MRIGGKVECNEDEEKGGWDSIAEHVDLNVILDELSLVLCDCSIYCEEKMLEM